MHDTISTSFSSASFGLVRSTCRISLSGLVEPPCGYREISQPLAFFPAARNGIQHESAYDGQKGCFHQRR